MRTHYTATALSSEATVGQVMTRKTACGAKATQSAALYMSNAWANVDCKRCLAKKEALEARAAIKATREASMANHPAGKAAPVEETPIVTFSKPAPAAPAEDDTDGDPTVITAEDAVTTAESWARATGSRVVTITVQQRDADGVVHETVSGTCSITPAGAKVSEVPGFDRSQKVHFHCPTHPGKKWVSKDPYSSTWFPAGPYDADAVACHCADKFHTDSFVVSQDYITTRR